MVRRSGAGSGLRVHMRRARFLVWRSRVRVGIGIWVSGFGNWCMDSFDTISWCISSKMQKRVLRLRSLS